MLERVEEALDVAVHDVAVAASARQANRLQRVRRAAFRAEAVRAVLEVRLEDRLQHDLRRRLHHAVLHRRDAQRSLSSIGFGDVAPLDRARAILPAPKLFPDLLQEALHSGDLDRVQRRSIDPGRAAVRSYPSPCFQQDVAPVDPVVQRVETATSVPLGCAKQRALELSYFVFGVVGPCGHALALTSRRTLDQSRAPSLRRRCGRRHRRYYEPLGLPLGTIRFRRRLMQTAFA